MTSKNHKDTNSIDNISFSVKQAKEMSQYLNGDTSGLKKVPYAERIYDTVKTDKPTHASKKEWNELINKPNYSKLCKEVVCCYPDKDLCSNDPKDCRFVIATLDYDLNCEFMINRLK